MARRVGSMLFPSRFPPQPLQSVAYERIPLEGGDEDAMRLMEDDDEKDSGESSSRSSVTQTEKVAPNFLPTRRMFTGSLVLVLCAAILQEMHMAMTGVITPYFLMEPVATEEQKRRQRLPFMFSGGAGFQPHSIAVFAAMAGMSLSGPVAFNHQQLSDTESYLGMITMPAHIFLYPRVVQRIGTLWTWRLALIPFFVLYPLLPYASIIPSTTPPPSEKTGFWIWAFIVFIKVFGSLATFSVASLLLLTTLASPHPSALGRTHSIAFMLTEGTRAITTGASGLIYAWGSSHNLVGLLFWFASLVCLPEMVASMFVKEGNGHAIRMEGDEEEKTERDVRQVSKA